MGAKLQRKTTLHNLLRKTCAVSEISILGPQVTGVFEHLKAMVQGYFYTLGIEPMTSRMLG
eukprot:3649990-Amphidinium_carterae.1